MRRVVALDLPFDDCFVRVVVPLDMTQREIRRLASILDAWSSPWAEAERWIARAYAMPVAIPARAEPLPVRALETPR